MNVRTEVLSLLDEILGLGGRGKLLADGAPLLGSIPELDSMAVVSLLAALEERFGFRVDDDEIDGSTFATVSSLVQFVSSKL